MEAAIRRDGPSVAAGKGFARACGSVFPGSRTGDPDPEGRAAGAPDVTDGGGVLEGGARPPLL
jgi:hypothetical protein